MKEPTLLHSANRPFRILSYDKSSTIFQRSLLHSLSAGFGLWAPKYNRFYLDQLLQSFFPNNIQLAQTVTPTVVLSYSLTKDALSLWSSYRAKKEINANIKIADAAGATSAAPLYFAPKSITFPHGNKSEEVDGGIYANDPEDIAVTEAFLQNPNLKPQQIFLLSLGTVMP